MSHKGVRVEEWRIRRDGLKRRMRGSRITDAGAEAQLWPAYLS